MNLVLNKWQNLWLNEKISFNEIKVNINIYQTTILYLRVCIRWSWLKKLFWESFLASENCEIFCSIKLSTLRW